MNSISFCRTSASEATSDFRLPKYLSSDGEVPSLLAGKILRYDSVICAAEVSNAVSEIHPDVNLAIMVCDLVDDLHRNGGVNVMPSEETKARRTPCDATETFSLESSLPAVVARTSNTVDLCDDSRSVHVWCGCNSSRVYDVPSGMPSSPLWKSSVMQTRRSVSSVALWITTIGSSCRVTSPRGRNRQ